MFKHYLIAKTDSKGAVLIIDGHHKRVEKDWPSFDEILKLVSDYNSTKDLDVRKEIGKKIKELTSSQNRETLQNHPAFSSDPGGNLYFTALPNEPLDDFITKKILENIQNGYPVTALENFLRNLQLNVDPNVRKQLYGFLEHNGHPITDMGYFVAYKAVNIKRKFDTKTGEQVITYDEDTGQPEPKSPTTELTYTSIHKGPHGDVIKVGEPVSMPRKECDPDPHRTCSAGLHVGSMDYVGSFGYSGSVILEVLINPMNVVSVPVDYNNTKMRVCEYYPYAIHNGENKEIYLESDYEALDAKTKKQVLVDTEKAIKDQIEKLETELEAKKKANGGIL